MATILDSATLAAVCRTDYSKAKSGSKATKTKDITTIQREKSLK